MTDDLMSENEQLRQRVAALEEIDKARGELVKKYTTERWRWLESTVELQTHGFNEPLPKTGEDLADYVTWNATALTVELGEALSEIGWKRWSSPRGWVNREAFLGECVDVGHFLANMLAAVGITDDEWEDGYRRKQQVNLERQLKGYDARKEKCPACGRAYDDTAVRCRRARGMIKEPEDALPYCEDYGYLEVAGK